MLIELLLNPDPGPLFFLEFDFGGFQFAFDSVSLGQLGSYLFLKISKELKSNEIRAKKVYIFISFI